MKKVDFEVLRPNIVPRPWSSGKLGEIRGDAVTGLPYAWNGVEWEPAVPSTLKPFTLYLDPAGSDSAAGDSANPLASLEEVFKRLPPEIDHSIVIDPAAGTYNQSNEIDNTYITGNGNILVTGKQALYAPATGVGPSGVVSTGGDRSTITVAAAGWTPQDLRECFLVFTAGPHTGEMVPVIHNDATTLWLYDQGTAWSTPWQAGETFDIYKNTVVFQSTIPFGDTLKIGSVSGSYQNRLKFEKCNLYGDPAFALTLRLSGPQIYLEFEYCYVRNSMYAFTNSGGMVSFVRCGHDVYYNGGFWGSSQPGEMIYWNMDRCAFLSSYSTYIGYMSKLILILTNFISNSSSAGAVCAQRGQLILEMNGSSIECLHPNASRMLGITYGAGSFLHMRASSSRIMRSNRSGIQPFGWVDLGTGSLSLSSVDILDCTIDGIDLRGPFACNLVDVVSSTPNGNVGVYLRSGAQAKSAGITTITGLAGDIDIGAGPAAWGTIPATDATELTRITV